VLGGNKIIGPLTVQGRISVSDNRPGKGGEEGERPPSGVLFRGGDLPLGANGGGSRRGGFKASFIREPDKYSRKMLLWGSGKHYL